MTLFEREFGSFVRIICYIFSLCFLCFMVFMVLAYFRIASYAFDTYTNVEDIPHNEVGLLLGTSSLTADGSSNPFFVNRIRAAALLYKKGKIDYIIVSGDNRHVSYNEPRQMMNALIRSGVPKDRLIADFAGFSTIDSVVRAYKVFMLKNVTIISQEFHNERALFIADHEGLEAIGFNAHDPSSRFSHAIVYFREIFARIKCVLDVYFLHTQPTFLGDPIQIGSNPLPKEPSNYPKHATSRPKVVSDAAFILKNGIEIAQRPAKEQTDAAIILKQKEFARQHLEQLVTREQS